jgi:hypothetical protein
LTWGAEISQVFALPVRSKSNIAVASRGIYIVEAHEGLEPAEQVAGAVTAPQLHFPALLPLAASDTRRVTTVTVTVTTVDADNIIIASADRRKEGATCLQRF